MQGLERRDPADRDWPGDPPLAAFATLEVDPASVPDRGSVGLVSIEARGVLGAVVRLREDENPVCLAAVRLLLLTGCRVAPCAGARSGPTA